jgi:hypothetical protein
MRYQALKHKTIQLNSKAQTELDAGEEGLTLVPEENSKVFLHWKTDTGKLVTTYTMTFPTFVQGTVTLINALDKSVQIRAVW